MSPCVWSLASSPLLTLQLLLSTVYSLQANLLYPPRSVRHSTAQATHMPRALTKLQVKKQTVHAKRWILNHSTHYVYLYTLSCRRCCTCRRRWSSYSDYCTSWRQWTVCLNFKWTNCWYYLPIILALPFTTSLSLKSITLQIDDSRNGQLQLQDNKLSTFTWWRMVWWCIV